MRWWIGLRVLVYLKRLSQSAERQADALETLARIESDRWQQQYGPRPKGKFIVGQLDVKAANERWHRQQEADKYGTEP